MIDIGDDQVAYVHIRVAERLGWRAMEYALSNYLVGHPPGKKIISVVPSYARDVRAAWEIVEFLSSRKIRTSIMNEAVLGPVRNYYVEIGERPHLLGKANNRSAALAICLALIDIPDDEFSRIAPQEAVHDPSLKPPSAGRDPQPRRAFRAKINPSRPTKRHRAGRYININDRLAKTTMKAASVTGGKA